MLTQTMMNEELDVRPKGLWYYYYYRVSMTMVPYAEGEVRTSSVTLTGVTSTDVNSPYLNSWCAFAYFFHTQRSD